VPDLPRDDALQQQAQRLVVLDVQTNPLARSRSRSRARARSLAVALALASALSACKLDDAIPPSASSPAAAASDAESRASARLRAHVLTIPGVADASVVVSRPPSDAFARGARDHRAQPARVAFVVVTSAGADSGVIGDAAVTAARTALGADADVQVQLAPPPAPPRLTSVGPFTVGADSRAALLATLVVALVLVIGLAATLTLALIALRYRRGIKPHQSSSSTTRGS
jgi:hypothetical protein